MSYELFPWTHELGASTLSALVDLGPTDGTLHFRGSPSELASVKRGDVLLSGASATTPSGLLRQVTSIAQAGGETVIATKPVPIQLAFKKLHGRIAGAAAGLDGAPVLGAKSLHSESTIVGGVRSTKWQPFNEDHDEVTKDDQFIFKAKLGATLKLTAWIDLDWLDDGWKAAEELACAIKPLCTPSLPDVKMGAKAEADASGEIDVDGVAWKGFDSGPQTLDGAPIALPTLVAGPLVVDLSLDFVGAVSGSTTARFHDHLGVGYKTSASVSIGLKSAPSFTPDATKTFQPPVVDAMVSGDVKTSVGPRVNMLFWGMVGPSVALTPYARVRADTSKTPCWTLDAGVEVSAGIILRIPWTLLGLEELATALGVNKDLIHETWGPWPLFQEPSLATGACGSLPSNIYPPGDGPTVDAYNKPGFVPWSRRYTNWSTTFDYSGDTSESKLHVDKSVDGGWFVSGLGIPGVLKVSEAGVVDWAKLLRMPSVLDEAVVPPDDVARATVAAQALDLRVWVATSRMTIVKLDQDGDVVRAVRYRPDDAALAKTLDPVGVLPQKDGGALAVYAVRDEAKDGPAVVLSVDKKGALRWAKTFQYETTKTFVPAIGADGDDAILAGFSWSTTTEKAHVTRIRPDGTIVWSKAMDVCGNVRARPADVVRLGSGAYAIAGGYSLSPERSFIAQVSPDGMSGTIGAWWTGNILQDERVNGLAQLPVTGFVSVGDRLGYQMGKTVGGIFVTSHDAQGTLVWQRELVMTDPTGEWNMRPSAARLTNDGGVFVFARVASAAQKADGVWISKLPAKDGSGTFDPNLVQSVMPSSPNVTCTLALADDGLTLTDLPIKVVDVTASVKSEPLAPQATKLIP